MASDRPLDDVVTGDALDAATISSRQTGCGMLPGVWHIRATTVICMLAFLLLCWAEMKMPEHGATVPSLCGRCLDKSQPHRHYSILCKARRTGALDVVTPLPRLSGGVRSPRAALGL